MFSVFFFFKQKTAYEMRISDWSSDVCSSDLHRVAAEQAVGLDRQRALGAVGDEADRGYCDHRQRQRGDEDADIPRSEVAAQLPPRQTQQLHASTSRPPSSRSTRLQREARCSSWVTSTRVVPASAFIANSSSITASPVWVSRLPVGSSASSSDGAVTKARASATRCCSPPESWRG